MTCSGFFVAPPARPPTSRAVPPSPARPSVALSEAPLNPSRRLCDSALAPSFLGHGIALLPPVESRELFADQLIHSPSSGPFNTIIDESPRSATSSHCCQSPCSSTSQCSPATTSPLHSNFLSVHSSSPYSSHSSQLPCSPCSSESSFVTYVFPTECLDWREWIDEIVEEVRNELKNETSFYSSANSSRSSQTVQPKASSRKRKVPSSGPASVDSGISVGSVPTPSKRAKKYSLATLSHEQIAERKKEQNRVAAQRYRTRKTQTLEEGRKEISHLEKRNADLRLDIYNMEQEIRQLKQQLVGEPCASA